MPHRLSAEQATELAVEILVAYGAPPETARAVAGHLVDADRAGVGSHGLLRIPQYVDEVIAGEIDPMALPSVRDGHGGRVNLEGRRCFGQVAGEAAVEHGMRLAGAHGLGLVTVRQCGHAGRIGAYAERLGSAGYLSMIFCSGPRSGHRVAPFGGREGRLATNPIAFSVPTSGAPIVGDFSTAAAPEGRIRALRNLGLEAFPSTLLDAEGVPSLDPEVLYRTPPGTIMPLGGEQLGHRGFALGLLVEAVATLLTGDETADPGRVGNNLAFVVIAVDAGYRGRADLMSEYILSSRPRDGARVALPGTLEREHRAQAAEVVVEDSTWVAIAERAERVGLGVG
jgi:LDH2 family malate/lactate/ureidoglycolate dehydrogenase